MKRILLLSAISLGVFCCGRQDSKPVVTPAGAASAPARPAVKDDSIRVYGKLTKAELAIVDLLEQSKVTAASRALARLPIGDRSPAAPLIEAWCLLEQYECLNQGGRSSRHPRPNRSLDEFVRRICRFICAPEETSVIAYFTGVCAWHHRLERATFGPAIKNCARHVGADFATTSEVPSTEEAALCWGRNGSWCRWRQS